MPISSPPTIIMVCPGVQNSSRPTDLCQDSSTMEPTVRVMTPMKTSQMVQGIETASADAEASERLSNGGATETVSVSDIR
jgi:hypothetical protein